MDDKQLTDDIRSALWHIASSLKGIEQKLEQLDTVSISLIGIEGELEAFIGRYEYKSAFKRHLDLLEKQVALSEEQEHMRQYRK
tara:strand:- start:50 stop:301 length:252 start_codon:yes stop_codon:yes gene_type:complete